jgi:glycosyltransferase involved in cell wall biosynthesis
MQGRGYRVRVVSLGGSPIENIDTVILPRRGKISFLALAGRAARQARRFAPHVAHAHYATGYGLWAMRSRIRPLIVSAWGSDVIDFPSNPFKRMLIRKVLTRADRVTVTGRYLKEVVCRLAPGIEPGPAVIPFGVEIPKAPPPLPAPPVRLCYPKAHYPYYGPQVLLEAMAALKRAGGDIRLSMAGSGPMTDDLKKLADRLGLADAVTFAGFVPPEKMYAFIAEHHLVVMPSLREAFGVAALEAGACARAVVASDVGGLPEVVREGETGRLVPPNDPSKLAEAITELATDRPGLETMGRAGYRLVKDNYSQDKSLDMMAELYEQAIDEKNQSTPL